MKLMFQELRWSDLCFALGGSFDWDVYYPHLRFGLNGGWVSVGFVLWQGGNILNRMCINRLCALTGGQNSEHPPISRGRTVCQSVLCFDLGAKFKLSPDYRRIHTKLLS